MDEILERIGKAGVLPVVTTGDASAADGIAGAIAEGGIHCAAVSFSDGGAADAVSAIRRKHPDFLTGAEGVSSVPQAEKAVKSGAEFLMSRGYDRELAEWSRRNGVPYVPGVRGAGEAHKAAADGFGTLNLFLAKATGGGDVVLDDICGELPDARLIVTGEFSAKGAVGHATSRNAFAVSGACVAEPDAIANGGLGKITSLCRAAAAAFHGFGFAHMGVNCSGRRDADAAASLFSVFGMEPNVTAISTFMDSDIELMHENGRGTKGHIGFGTYDVERALPYLAEFGFNAMPDSARRDSSGKMKLVYLDGEIGGFAIHLVRRD